MAKVTYGSIVVSFNCSYGDYELGESDMNSIDFTGDDAVALVKEVIADSLESFPLKWIPIKGSKNKHKYSGMYGRFVSADDVNYTVALMLKFGSL